MFFCCLGSHFLAQEKGPSRVCATEAESKKGRCKESILSAFLWLTEDMVMKCLNHVSIMTSEVTNDVIIHVTRHRRHHKALFSKAFLKPI